MIQSFAKEYERCYLEENRSISLRSFKGIVGKELLSYYFLKEIEKSFKKNGMPVYKISLGGFVPSKEKPPIFNFVFPFNFNDSVPYSCSSFLFRNKNEKNGALVELLEKSSLAYENIIPFLEIECHGHKVSLFRNGEIKSTVELNLSSFDSYKKGSLILVISKILQKLSSKYNW